MIQTKKISARPSYAKKLFAALSIDDIFNAFGIFLTSFAVVKVIPAIYYMEKVPLLDVFARDLTPTERDRIDHVIEAVVPADVIQRAWSLGLADLAMMIAPLLVVMVMSRFTKRYIYNDFKEEGAKAPVPALAYAWVLDAIDHVIERYIFFVPIIFVFFPTLLGGLL